MLRLLLAYTSASVLVLAVSAFVPSTPALNSVVRTSKCSISMSAGDQSMTRRAALFSIPASFLAAQVTMFSFFLLLLSEFSAFWDSIFNVRVFQSAGAYDFSKLRDSGAFADEAPVGTKPKIVAPPPEPVKVRDVPGNTEIVRRVLHLFRSTQF